jgi:hypothetical protein
MARRPVPWPIISLSLLAAVVCLAWAGTRALRDGLGTLRWLQGHSVASRTQAQRASRIASVLTEVPHLGKRWVWTLQPLLGGPTVRAVLVDGGPWRSHDTVDIYRVTGLRDEVRLSAGPRYAVWGAFLIGLGVFTTLITIGMAWLAFTFTRTRLALSKPTSA